MKTITLIIIGLALSANSFAQLDRTAVENFFGKFDIAKIEKFKVVRTGQHDGGSWHWEQDELTAASVAIEWYANCMSVSDGRTTMLIPYDNISKLFHHVGDAKVYSTAKIYLGS